MKFNFIVAVLAFSINVFGQVVRTNVRNLATTKYKGRYCYGIDIEKGRIGSIAVYPETESTVLFYVDQGSIFYKPHSPHIF